MHIVQYEIAILKSIFDTPSKYEYNYAMYRPW